MVRWCSIAFKAFLWICLFYNNGTPGVNYKAVIIKNDFDLSTITSFGTGGMADRLVDIENTIELTTTLPSCERPLWFLGSGANVLISDKGLPGTTVRLQTKYIAPKENLLIADAGADWDDLVKCSIVNNFWGLERTSGIPGSVGAAVVGNIAAYGQAVADSLQWVEVLDVDSNDLKTFCMNAEELKLDYRYSIFQEQKYRNFIITRAAFLLSAEPKPLQYESALQVAKELSLDIDDLAQRRDVIIGARRRAGSLLEKDSKAHKTAGSFFRNPLVTKEQAEEILRYEEKHVPAAAIRLQNQIHGGSNARVSAAHVLLAAGFKRGQSWGSVRLHPDHVLKIENTGGATSQQIYEVAQEIISTVQSKLGITLEPEVRFLGEFS